MTSRSRALSLALACLWGLAACDAAAQQRPRRSINVDVVVSELSQRPPEAPPEVPGLTSRLNSVPRRVQEIDERVRRLDATLRKQFRYDDIRVVERHRMVLEMDEVGTVRLPNGRRFRARPIDVNEQGVLMAVEVEDSVNVDVRAPNNHLVVIGAEPYGAGKLVISIEPSY